MARAVRGEMPVAFHYTAGVGNAAFLEALRARGVFLGSRCDTCGVTYLPARIFCERCFGALGPGVECGPGGVLESFTVARVGIDDEALDEPAVVGLIRLDGADTLFVHRLLGDDGWAVGMRVAASLRPPDARTGSVLDVEGFRPA